MMHRHVSPDLRGQRSVGVRGHGEVRGTGSGGAGPGSGGAGPGSGPGGKSNLAAQIIPVYGFGILLYILYILFKITSKGHSKPSQSRLHNLRSENHKRKITDFELSQLQERLRETELVMENLVNTSLQEQDSALTVSVDQEQNLLQQLTEITRAMKTNHLVQDFTSTGPSTQTGLLDDVDPFLRHCSCHCPQPHEEDEEEPEESSWRYMKTSPADQQHRELLIISDPPGELQTISDPPGKHQIISDLLEEPETMAESGTERAQPKPEIWHQQEEHLTAAGEEQENMEAPEVHLEKQAEMTEEVQPKLEVTISLKDQYPEDCPCEERPHEEEHIYQEIQRKIREGLQKELQLPANRETDVTVFHREEIVPHTVVTQAMVPQTVDLQTVAPQTMDPQTIYLQTIDPQTMDPQTMDLQTMNPETMDLQTMDPQTMDLQTMDPQTMDLQTMDPQTVGPQMAPQVSEVCPQSSEQKVGPGPGLRRRNRKRRGRKLKD